MPTLGDPMSPPCSRFARPLRRACLHAACLLSASLAGAGLAGAAQAGPLADPTRPPSTTATTAGGADTGQARTRDDRLSAPATRQAPVAAPLPVLQSVRVPTTGPAVAIIDGQLVQAGDTVGGRLVQAIDRLGITLAGRSGPERVLLLGGSPKQPPGSIATTHATRYEPAAADTADRPVRADRPGLAMPTATTSPTTPAPLSVAARTAP